MTDPLPSARVTAVLGELNLKFERLSAPDGQPLWNVPFAVEGRSGALWVTLYLAGAWVVALHVFKDGLVAETDAIPLLELNGRLLGARVAVNNDRRAMVIADLSLTSLDKNSMWTMLEATVAASRLLPAAVTSDREVGAK